MTTETLVEQLTDEQKKRAEYVSGLRELADLYERETELPLSVQGRLDIFVDSIEEANRFRRMVGKMEKKAWGLYFIFARDFGASVLEITMHRDKVCKKKITGKRVIPAVKEKFVPSHTIPATPEKVEDVYEWVCPDSVLKEAAGDLPQ